VRAADARGAVDPAADDFVKRKFDSESAVLRSMVENDGHHLQRAQARPSQELLLPQNYLEVGFTADMREIVINYPDGNLHFSPEQARRLANTLLRKAIECKP
jgi:hypothetical protein